MSSSEVGNIDFLHRHLNPKLEVFGKVLICWDCKKELPEEKDQYQHANLWPLCRECAENRELLKLGILRAMSRRRPTDG